MFYSLLCSVTHICAFSMASINSVSDILKSSGSDSLSDWRNLLHQKLDFHHYFNISVQCPRSVEEAYKVGMFSYF